MVSPEGERLLKTEVSRVVRSLYDGSQLRSSLCGRRTGEPPVPGSTTASKELVNNLDLTLTAGANTCKGNVFNGAFSTNGGAADGANTVDGVFLPPGAVTNFTVTVSAAQISADAITNGGSLPEQDFALVIYNAQIAVPVNFNYRVQHKNNLTDTNWTDLTPDI